MNHVLLDGLRSNPKISPREADIKLGYLNPKGMYTESQSVGALEKNDITS